jgi:Methyltransferase domain
MVMTSKEAAREWRQPIRLLWIDGDHRYESVKQDFLLWEPFVVNGGIIAMHDTIRKQGPKKVLWENVFRSWRFQEIAIVDNITAARKVRKASLLALLKEGVNHCLKGNLYRRAQGPISICETCWSLAAKEMDLSNIAAGDAFHIFLNHGNPILPSRCAPLESVKLIFQSERT